MTISSPAPALPLCVRMSAKLAWALGARIPPVGYSGLPLISTSQIFVWTKEGDKLAWGIIPPNVFTKEQMLMQEKKRGKF